MSESQRHGFDFERHVIDAAHRVRSQLTSIQTSGFEDKKQAYTAKFDLPAEMDPTGANIPTHIKLAKRQRNGRVRVDMADARRAIALSELPKTRFVVGVYEQVGEHKRIDEIREYVVSGSDWSTLACVAPESDIREFHEALAHGTPEEARAYARKQKSHLAQTYPGGVLKWSPKIDSKTQRRLQCSLYLDELDQALKDASGSTTTVYQEPPALWGMGLPIKIPSPPRARNKKSTRLPQDLAEKDPI